MSLTPRRLPLAVSILVTIALAAPALAAAANVPLYGPLPMPSRPGGSSIAPLIAKNVKGCASGRVKAGSCVRGSSSSKAASSRAFSKAPPKKSSPKASSASSSSKSSTVSAKKKPVKKVCRNGKCK